MEEPVITNLHDYHRLRILLCVCAKVGFESGFLYMFHGKLSISNIIQTISNAPYTTLHRKLNHNLKTLDHARTEISFQYVPSAA